MREAVALNDGRAANIRSEQGCTICCVLLLQHPQVLMGGS